MALTIDDTVNQGHPPGYAASANVMVVPNYTAGAFLPDGSNTIAVLEYQDPATKSKLNQQTMAKPVSFDFPAPQVFSSNPFAAR